MTTPGVGPIVALTFQAVLDDPARFGGDAARASAFVGLVPREDSSAERQHKGPITKTGPGELRAMLVQASWVIWRSRSPRRRRLAHVGRRRWPPGAGAASRSSRSRGGSRASLCDVARWRRVSEPGRDGARRRNTAEDTTRRGRAESRGVSAIRSMVAREAVHVDGATPHPNPTLRDDDLVHSTTRIEG